MSAPEDQGSQQQDSPIDPSIMQDGPDRFWPQQTLELKPIGMFDSVGRLVGFRFQNPYGTDRDVMAPSDIFHGAIIYQGSKNGVRKTMETATILGQSNSYTCVMFRVSSARFMSASLPRGYRRAELRLRITEMSEEEDRSYPGGPPKPSPEDEIMAIVWPLNEKVMLEAQPPGWSIQEKSLVVEQVVQGGPWSERTLAVALNSWYPAMGDI
ncbi:hypothetical protein F53441_12321 [Fusarium austroafricanum]|uniref:Uncharacterized protein n=1 Tax=Fusarium austroafricanum TaxID=2364996 RepID=A0A8H4NPG2_9HYPO|nr:hypothetical protein F53441_12321 [Fusarium austroafricanum]